MLLPTKHGQVKFNFEEIYLLSNILLKDMNCGETIEAAIRRRVSFYNVLSIVYLNVKFQFSSDAIHSELFMKHVETIFF